MNQQTIVIEEKKCTGCRSCEYACSFIHKKAFLHEYSLIRIHKHKKEKGFFVVALCLHCEKARCIEACLSGAMGREGGAGIVKIDKEKCSSCGVCVDACPWSIPIIDLGEKVAKICDRCGGEPLCVQFCTPGALRIETNPIRS